jgi:hypothetical protein
MTKYKICVCCDEKIKNEDELEYTFDKEPICQSCLHDDESEPIAQVVPIGDNEDFNNLEYSGYGFTSYGIGSYHNWTDGLFSCGYSSADQWRGAYQPTSDKYTEIDENHITMGYPGNDDDLKEQKERIEKIVKDNNLRGCYVVSRTSNCLSQGLGYWVHNEDLDKYNKAVKQLEIKTQ